MAETLSAEVISVTGRTAILYRPAEGENLPPDD
jgi:RNA-binding protein YhbY